MIENYGSIGTARTSRMSARSLCGVIAVLLVAANAMADNGQERARRQAAKMSYLDNGVIRLGVDLNLGGAITYLSRGRERGGILHAGRNALIGVPCGTPPGHFFPRRPND